MRSMRGLCKLLGYLVLAFGAGIILTYFLPCSVLVVIEAIIIIAAGVLYLMG